MGDVASGAIGPVRSYGADLAGADGPRRTLAEWGPDRTRYGLYLRPDPETCRAQAATHDLLERQYGLRAAGRFMPHATVKGFTRSDADPLLMVARLDDALAAHRAFPVTNRGAIPYGPTSVVLDIHHDEDDTPNQPLQALHESVLGALLPLASPDCAFTRVEGKGDRFHAHLTLAMADLPPWLGEEVLAFLRALGPIGPRRWVADTLTLFAFRSDAWDGPWWESLAWLPLHGWRLPG